MLCHLVTGDDRSLGDINSQYTKVSTVTGLNQS